MFCFAQIYFDGDCLFSWWSTSTSIFWRKQCGIDNNRGEKESSMPHRSSINNEKEQEGNRDDRCRSPRKKGSDFYPRLRHESSDKCRKWMHRIEGQAFSSCQKRSSTGRMTDGLDLFANFELNLTWHILIGQWTFIVETEWTWSQMCPSKKLPALFHSRNTLVKSTSRHGPAQGCTNRCRWTFTAEKQRLFS